MSDIFSYSYTILRYVHDIVTGEFLNVGVVVYCPEKNYLRAKTRRKISRLTNCFKGANATAARNSIRHIEEEIREMGKSLDSLFPNKFLSARDIALKVLPHDDSSLQWSELGAGRTRDPNNELDRLFDRMVARYDLQNDNRKTEHDVWRHFDRALQRRNISVQLQTKTIASSADRIIFEHAWKNGKWHCLAPLSFDLVDPESIRNKARRHVGQLSALADANETFAVYFLLGEPSDPGMEPDFEQAVRILKSSQSVPVEVFKESQADEFSDRIAAEMKHQAPQDFSLE